MATNLHLLGIATNALERVLHVSTCLIWVGIKTVKQMRTKRP